MEVVLELKNVGKRFGELFALKNINFKVERGDIFGIIGPDGAGKSTLMKLICGLVKHDEGEINIMGMDIRKGIKALKGKLGYLAQEFILYEDLTVDENIEFFSDIYGIKDWKRKREEILKFTNLLPFRKRLAGRLSGGMKKKLALACTLIHEPEIFVLDEPTLGVDPVSRVELWKLIFDLSRRNLAILLSTSYIDEAERCSKIAIIFRGEVLFLGNPDELRKREEKKVIELHVSDVTKALKILKKNFILEDLYIYGENIRITTSSPTQIMENLKEIFSLEGIEVFQSKVQFPSVEDSFIYLLRERENV